MTSITLESGADPWPVWLSGDAYGHKGEEMVIRSHLTAGMVSLACVQAGAGADVLQLELGQFYFRGDYPTIYSGDYQSYLAESHEGPYQRPVSEIQVGAIMKDLDLGPIAWIRISGPDTETSLVNPGADIDLFRLEGLAEDVHACYAYNGPNALYHGASSESLAAEVAAVDFLQGQSDTDSTFVSLGTSGSMLMWFEGATGGHDNDGGGSDGSDNDSDEGDDGDTDSGDDHGADNTLNMDVIWGSAYGGQAGEGVDLAASVQGVSGSNLWLRINEIAPISEWVSIDVGYYHQSSVPIPGPTGAIALGVGAFLARVRRRR